MPDRGLLLCSYARRSGSGGRFAERTRQCTCHSPRALGANWKMETIKRPTVALAGTGEAWSYFVIRWGEYKTGTKLVGPDVVAQLLECCDEELRKDLTRAADKNLIKSDEKDVLAAMKSPAVRIRIRIRMFIYLTHIQYTLSQY